jgi:hypothetical protein
VTKQQQHQQELKKFRAALQNRRFTWSHERQNPRMIKHDGVFCNEEWEFANRVQLGTLKGFG